VTTSGLDRFQRKFLIGKNLKTYQTERFGLAEARPKLLPGARIPSSGKSLMERTREFCTKLRQISLRPSVSFDRLPFALPPAGFSGLVLLLDDYSARPIP
jgi:hypothetical protein